MGKRTFSSSCESFDYSKSPQSGQTQYSSDETDSNPSNELDYFSRSKKPKCLSKNAIMARNNRIKKKAYIEGLQRDNFDLKEETSKLREQLENQTVLLGQLKREVNYLRAVVSNSKDITRLLKGLNSVFKKGSQEEAPTENPSTVDPHGYLSDCEPLSRNYLEDVRCTTPTAGLDETYSPGICLHITNQNLSLEYCSSCNSSSLSSIDGLSELMPSV